MNTIDKIKKFLQIDDEAYEEEYYEKNDVEEIEEKNEEIIELEGKTIEEDFIMVDSTLIIHEPITYEDGGVIINDIRAGKIVVIDFSTLDNEKKKQIFEFVNGGVFAVDAQIKKVNNDIFVVAPMGRL